MTKIGIPSCSDNVLSAKIKLRIHRSEENMFLLHLCHLWKKKERKENSGFTTQKTNLKSNI